MALLENLQELSKGKHNSMVLKTAKNSKDADLCMIIGSLSGFSMSEEVIEESNKTLPQLKIGESELNGANEICKFLAESGSKPELFGKCEKDKSAVDLWFNWIEENLVLPGGSA